MSISEKLRKVYSEILEKEDISESENIFDLGGNSASVYIISSRLKETFDIDLKPIDIMMYPSIEKLAAYIESGSAAESMACEEVTVRRRSRRHVSE